MSRKHVWGVEVQLHSFCSSFLKVFLTTSFAEIIYRRWDRRWNDIEICSSATLSTINPMEVNVFPHASGGSAMVGALVSPASTGLNAGK